MPDPSAERVAGHRLGEHIGRDQPTVKLDAAGGRSVLARNTGAGVQLQDANFNVWDLRQFTLAIEDGSVWHSRQ